MFPGNKLVTTASNGNVLSFQIANVAAGQQLTGSGNQPVDGRHMSFRQLWSVVAGP